MGLEEKKGSKKKAGPPKCRACGGLLDEKERIRLGGSRWHRRCAENKGKKIPREYANVK